MTFMPSTTDSELLDLSSKYMQEAEVLLGLPAPEVSPGFGAAPGRGAAPVYDFDSGLQLSSQVVSGSGWDDIAERAAQLLKRAWEMRPINQGAKAAERLREAARQGLNRASSASKAARDTLQKVALGASLLGLSTLILPGLIVFAIVESSGAGKRLRGAGRRYVSARAREYGV